VIGEPPKLSGRHQDTLRHVLAHPLSHNVEWRALLALLREVGSVEEHGDGNIAVEAGGQRLVFTQHHEKDVDADDLVEVRRFLEALGYRPAEG
jgi:hypothetical protein